MSTQGTIKRYTLIIEKISLKQHPNFEELSEFLDEHGFTISTRTLQRDIEQIRNEFGIEILYNRTLQGYIIDEENSLNLASFIKFLEMFNTADILSASLKDGKDILKFVSFEAQGNLKGIDNLRELVFAISNKRSVSFNHENYIHNSVKPYELIPLHLKEYQNRWYVFGFVTKETMYRTFGIDRIFNLKTKTKVHTFKASTHFLKPFDDVVGLNYSEENLEHIEVWVTDYQFKYLQSLPLHASQHIISQNKQGVVLGYSLKINRELVVKILSMGANAKVIKPKSFNLLVTTELKQMLKNYK